MFAYISGSIKDVNGIRLTVLPKGLEGLGFEIQVPEEYCFVAGQQCALELYTHTTQEQGSVIYGFKTGEEKQLFQLILGCSGFGPKAALSLIGAFSPSNFAAAILASDIKLLSKVEGVAARKAESLVMQLKDKIKKISFNSELSSSEAPALTIKKLNEVLCSLGYGRSEITLAFEHLRSQQLLSRPFDELIRTSLSFLVKK